MLLRGLQEELREYSSSTRTLTRSHTAKETKAQPRPSMRPRRSSVGASHSFSSPLAQIGEDHEETDMLLQSSSPGAAATDKSAEKRPRFLRLVSPPAAAAKEEPKNQPVEKGSAQEKRTISLDSSPRPHRKHLGQLKKPFTKKRSPVRTLSPRSDDSPSGSPHSSPVVPRRKPPPLAKIKELYGSSGFYADPEDSDTPSPKHSSISSPPPQLIIPNREALAKKTAATRVTVTAEVYESEPTNEQSKDRTSGRLTVSSPTNPSSSENSQDSSAGLLAPPIEAVLSAQSSFSHNESYDTQSDTEGLLHNPRSGAGCPPHKSSKVKGSPQETRKKSLSKSLDRKLSASLKELSSSLKESSHFIYKNLELAGDDSQC